jgi:hypothetical protein
MGATKLHLPGLMAGLALSAGRVLSAMLVVRVRLNIAKSQTIFP